MFKLNEIENMAWEIYKSGEEFVYLTLKDDSIYCDNIIGAHLSVVTGEHTHLGHIFTLGKDYKEIKREVRNLLNK